ncbi:hypothetical protein N0V88_002689 [Collariella sp. IMI 366227]|nr:hypothetical protein N0V88_002689 [Collariella sp. IMI 366227]
MAPASADKKPEKSYLAEGADMNTLKIPKRKPKFLQSKNSGDTKPQQPKKFVAFSTEDSRAIETAYQTKLQELEEERNQNNGLTPSRVGTKRPRATSSVEKPDTETTNSKTTVPVNEDFLFDVNIEDRELAPIYWEGPIYEVRRGSWFYQEGSALRPCEENLAAQLEEGYLKTKPWQYSSRSRSNSASKTVTTKPSVGNLKAAAEAQDDAAKKGPPAPQHQPQTQRLFGSYMNSIVTYQDSATAWLSSDGMLSWVTSTMYERFAGGGYMSGVKLVRGYAEAKKPKEKDDKRPSTPTGAKSTSKERGDNVSNPLKRRSVPPSESKSEPNDPKDEIQDDLASTRNRLTRQISNLIERAEDPEAEEEAIREREEKEISGDYNARVDDNQGRDIEHVVLVTHGIGQLLSRRMESINFVHDVNILRKTIKSVYSASADLRALNSEIGAPGLGNCRVQVLPVVWRHLLDFPKRKPRRAERDLGELVDEEDDYPALEDITVEGVAFARSLISDLALDVLLYQSAYREQIAEIVLQESNRIYKLFMERNPEFKGKVHILGHSLGSAIIGNEATLIDDELETLFSRFQKSRVEMGVRRRESKEGKGKEKDGKGGAAAAAGLSRERLVEEERKAQRLRREEMKIRALNRNGRVDYCIQESVLDFNPINTIASHMSYWADEDVSHFMLSQMLAGNKARTPKG